VSKPARPREPHYEVIVTHYRRGYPSSQAALIRDDTVYGNATSQRAADKLATDAGIDNPSGLIAVRLTEAGRLAAIKRSARRLQNGARYVEQRVSPEAYAGTGADPTSDLATTARAALEAEDLLEHGGSHV
jgi:hypothetical protein